MQNKEDDLKTAILSISREAWMDDATMQKLLTGPVKIVEAEGEGVNELDVRKGFIFLQYPEGACLWVSLITIEGKERWWCFERNCDDLRRGVAYLWMGRMIGWLTTSEMRRFTRILEMDPLESCLKVYEDELVEVNQALASEIEEHTRVSSLYEKATGDCNRLATELESFKSLAQDTKDDLAEARTVMLELQVAVKNAQVTNKKKTWFWWGWFN